MICPPRLPSTSRAARAQARQALAEKPQLGATAVLLLLAVPVTARAQSKSDAFAGKIPPVSAALYRKAGRFEATLSGNLSLNDPFYTKYFGGLKLGYHFTETLSAAGIFATGINTKAGSAQVCPSNSGCHSASRMQMFQVPGNIRMMGGVEGAWAPVYGKLNVLAEQVAHFDLSILLGPDLIIHDKILSAQEAAVVEANGGTPGTESSFGGHVGVAARLFLAEWVALRLEVKDYVYGVTVPNNASVGTDVQNQLFTELGFSFFFPTRNRSVR